MSMAARAGDREDVADQRDGFRGFNGFLLLSQVNTQRKAIVQLILEKRELLVGQRVKRDGTANLS